MHYPLVSCILATYNRSQFLRQALYYFNCQSYPNKELIVVDDSKEPGKKLFDNQENVKYIFLKARKTLGDKLNIGITNAQGEIIQKLDDDDYYHPNFLSSAVQKLLLHNENTVVASDCFLVLILLTMELKYSGNGWCAGNTLCFYKSLWEKGPFRDAAMAVDWYFLEDHQPERVKLHDPELVIVVRHLAGHLWKEMGKTSVDQYFMNMANYEKPLNDIISYDNWRFYKEMSENNISI